jgi:hypothetical protein
MVAEIESHSLLEVVEFSINPPANDEVFSAVEKKLGAPLSEPIRSFYAEANGLRLYWKIKSGLTEEDLDVIAEEYDDYDIGIPDEEEGTDDENLFAQIKFLSIEDSIIYRDWQNVIVFDELTLEDETINFAGMTYNKREFQRRIRPFDLYSAFSCMAFFLEKGVGNPKVLLLSGHYVEWDHSRITDFESYLEMLFATRGITEARKEIYGDYRGDKKPPFITSRSYWNQEYIPKLFRNK